jgi:hypothetical protein
MKKQLSEEQIVDLFLFCKLHDAKYYDVQIELVDHLASAIENRWLTEPNVGFEEALNDVYRTFGVGGFRKVRMEKEKELCQKYSRLQRKYLCEFFKLPKIILTVVIFFSLFLLFRYSPDNVSTYSSILGIYIVYIAYYLLALYPIKYRVKLEFGKNLLLVNQLRLLKRKTVNYAMLPISLFYTIMLSLVVLDIQMPNVDSFIYDFVIALFLALFGISIVVMLVYLPNRIKNEIFRLYPNIIIP